MNEHNLRKMLEGGGGGAGLALRVGLWLPGKAYGTLMQTRRLLYRRGWLASHRPPVPVVSIGNLTAGGSGKTPITILLANNLAARGRKPGILIRGYRAEDGHSDEAAMYHSQCPRAIIEADADRRAGSARAVAAGADILLMDDGFQHLAMRRDLDLALVDASSPWGGGNTLPGGLLREPKSTLRAADVVVITRSDQVAPAVLQAIRNEVAGLAPGSAVFTARHRPARLLRLDGSALPLSHLAGSKVVALSGIARPEAFHATLASLGAEVVHAVIARDHDQLSSDILQEAAAKAQSMGAAVVTTEKDRAKKIFAALTDNISVDNKSMADIILVLGIDQEIDGFAALMARVEGISSLQFAKTGAQ